MNDLPDLSRFGFEVTRFIGEGATSRVYEAKQLRLRNRLVAVKVLKPGLLDSSAVLERELEVAAKFKHPNVLAFYDLHAEVEPKFLVTELAEAGARRGKLPESAVLDAGIRLASALDAAHELGIVHSDIKPSNILWTARGEPKLGDFGTARLLDRTHLRSELGYSPRWAPASVRLDGTSKASDVWSLSGTLLHFLTGRQLSEIEWDEVPADWRELFRRAMPDDPSAAPWTAAALLLDLKRIQRERGSSMEGGAGPDPKPPLASPDEVSTIYNEKSAPARDESLTDGPSKPRWTSVIPAALLLAIVIAISYWQPWVSVGDDDVGETADDTDDISVPESTAPTTTSASGTSTAPVQTTSSTGPVDITPALKAVFASDRAGTLDLFRVDGETVSTLLQRDGDDASPSFSPDGENLVFETNDQGIRAVYQMKLATGDQVQLSNPGSEATSPRWSPTGESIAWVSRARGNRDIVVYDVESASERFVTTNSADDTAPSWSPDGRFLFFRSDRTGAGDIYRLEVVNGSLDRITSDAAPEDAPAGSASGAVAFSRRVSDDWEVFVLDAGAAAARRITSRDGFDSYPMFLGDSLFFVGQNGGESWIESDDGRRVAASAGVTRDLLGFD